MGALTVGAIAAVAVVVGFAFKRKSMFPKAVPWLWLLGGFGVAGVLGDLLVGVGGALSGVSTSVSVLVFGAAVPALVAIYLGVTLAIEMRPNGNPGKWTPWVALIFPAILATAGGTFTELHDNADRHANEAMAAVGTFFEDAVQGF